MAGSRRVSIGQRDQAWQVAGWRTGGDRVRDQRRVVTSGRLISEDHELPEEFWADSARTIPRLACAGNVVKPEGAVAGVEEFGPLACRRRALIDPFPEGVRRSSPHGPGEVTGGLVAGLSAMRAAGARGIALRRLTP